MQTLFDHYSQIFGITLLHSLWQGLIIYTLLRVLLLSFPSASANHKHNMALTALAASVVWPLLTLMSEIARHPYIQPVNNNVQINFAPLPFIPANAEAITSGYSLSIERYMPFLMVVWLIGIVLNSAKLYWGWKSLQQLKQTLLTTPFAQGRIKEFARQLNITKDIPVFLSEHLDVPCLAGYLKPMIILPASVITQFSVNQIESILIHEMAHIRRNDYLINLLQQVVGIVFFFNPFTYLINRIIYSERENCCDDLVLHITGEPLVYAQTLLQLEENRQQYHQLALAATGNKYHLLNRIKRIMETKKQVNNIRHILVAVLLLICSLGTIAWLNPEIKDGKVSIKPIKSFDFTLPGADTVKRVIKKVKKPLPASSLKAAKTKKTTVQKEANIYDMYANNPVYDKLAADVSRYSEEIGKFYDSPAYKKLEAEMDGKSKELDAFYNKPELKKLQDSLDVQQKNLDNLSRSPRIKEMQSKLDELDKKSRDLYNNDQYKALQKKFNDESKWFEKENASKSPDLKKHTEALEQAGIELRKYTANPQIKTDNEQMRLYGKQIQDFYNSADYQSTITAIRESSARMRNIYADPQIKALQQQVRDLGKQMRDYANSPEIAKEKALMKQAMERFDNYRNSPAYKKLEEERRKNMQAMSDAYRNQSDTTNKDGK